MDIQENENKPEILPIKDNLELDINENIIKEEKLEPKIIENIKSPQLIQDILHLSSHSTQNDYQHQNNLIKSLYSFNDSIIPILDDDFIEDKINSLDYIIEKEKLEGIKAQYNIEFGKLENFKNQWMMVQQDLRQIKNQQIIEQQKLEQIKNQIKTHKHKINIKQKKKIHQQ